MGLIRVAKCEYEPENNLCHFHRFVNKHTLKPGCETREQTLAGCYKLAEAK